MAMPTHYLTTQLTTSNTMPKFIDTDYSVQNILATFYQADAEQIIQGLSWYTTAQNDIITHLSNVPLWKACAIVSALSPRNRWANNIGDAVKVVKAHDLGQGPDDVSVCTFNSNKRKAFAIAALPNTDAGRIKSYELLKGDKTVSFAKNLDGYDMHVTIDGHATYIAKGDVGSLDSINGLTKRQYDYISGLYREAADIAGITAMQMQAITWLVYRSLKGLTD